MLACGVLAVLAGSAGNDRQSRRWRLDAAEIIDASRVIKHLVGHLVVADYGLNGLPRRLTLRIHFALAHRVVQRRQQRRHPIGAAIELIALAARNTIGSSYRRVKRIHVGVGVGVEKAVELMIVGAARPIREDQWIIVGGVGEIAVDAQDPAPAVWCDRDRLLQGGNQIGMPAGKQIARCKRSVGGSGQQQA